MENWENGLAWNEKFNTGNEKVDEQHKTIFKLISDMVEAQIKNESKEKLGEILDFLVNYTVEHFFYEEMFMLEIDYLNYANHKRLHEDFKATVTQIQENYRKQGTTDELMDIVNKTVITWVIQHIQREDVKIFDSCSIKNI